MQIKISLEKIISFLVIVVSIIFATTSSLINYVIPSVYVRLIVLLLTMVLIVLNTVSKFRIHKEVIWIIIMLSIALIRNGAQTVEVFTYSFSMILLIYCLDNTDWIHKYFKYTKIIYLAYAIITILFLFLPNFYLNNVVELFPDTKIRLIQWYNNGYMAGLTKHYSTNGMFLATGLITFFAYYLNDKSKKKKNLVFIAIMIVALLLTGKRAHILFSIFAMYVTYYLYLSDNKKNNRAFKVVGILILISVLAFLSFSIFPSLSVFIARFQETLEAGDITSSRLKFWKYAYELFLNNNKLMGIGWDQFQNYSFFYLKYRAHVHNIYIQLLCESGIIGLCLYIAWFINSIHKTIKSYIFYRKNIINDTKAQLLLTFSINFQIFFLLYGLTGNPLYDAEMYIPYFISCGIGLHFYLTIKKKSKGENDEKSIKQQKQREKID